MVFAKKAQKTVKDPTSNIEKVLDLGFVGEPVEVDRTLLDLLARSEMIPATRAPSNTTRAPISFSAIRLRASKTDDPGSTLQTVRPFASRMSRTVFIGDLLRNELNSANLYNQIASE